jgi:oxygen-independent coproporphyrinogen-3 oxidase
MTIDPEAIRLTPAGVERSDVIGPWLYSPAVRARMAAWEQR